MWVSTKENNLVTSEMSWRNRCKMSLTCTKNKITSRVKQEHVVTSWVDWQYKNYRPIAQSKQKSNIICTALSPYWEIWSKNASLTSQLIKPEAFCSSDSDHNIAYYTVFPKSMITLMLFWHYLEPENSWALDLLARSWNRYLRVGTSLLHMVFFLREGLNPSISCLYFWSQPRWLLIPGSLISASIQLGSWESDVPSHEYETRHRFVLNASPSWLANCRSWVLIWYITSINFTTWINFLYFEFKAIDFQPTWEQIDRDMPLCFKAKYPTTRLLLDATEIPLETP